MNVESLKIETLQESQIDVELDAKLRNYLCNLFPNWEEIFRVRRTWHNAKPRFTILARDDDEIVGHIAVVERTITTNWNFRYLVASVQGVSVVSQYRGSGLAVRLLELALAESRNAGYPYAILFCREPLVKFYERNGWRLPDDSVVMWHERKLPIHMQSNCPMYYELTDEPFPEGPIDVHNPL